ncbi:hypothetical protein [Methylomonas fluvii]|nr:hypothetical protein [Methylomonas fluvii]
MRLLLLSGLTQLLIVENAPSHAIKIANRYLNGNTIAFLHIS